MFYCRLQHLVIQELFKILSLSLPPFLSTSNPQPHLSRHLTISHAVPRLQIAEKKKKTQTFSSFWKTSEYNSAPAVQQPQGEIWGGKKKKNPSKMKREIVSVLKWLWPIPRRRRKCLCDGFLRVAPASALSRQQQELRHFSPSGQKKVPSLLFSTGYTQRTGWRLERETEESRKKGVLFIIWQPHTTSKSPLQMCTDDMSKMLNKEVYVLSNSSSQFLLYVLVTA